MKENQIEERNEIKLKKEKSELKLKKEQSDFNNSSIYDKTSLFDGLYNEINEKKKRGNTINNRLNHDPKQ